jgi:hypothetical protein
LSVIFLIISKLKTNLNTLNTNSIYNLVSWLIFFINNKTGKVIEKGNSPMNNLTISVKTGMVKKIN